jgi:hypothetical protein
MSQRNTDEELRLRISNFPEDLVRERFEDIKAVYELCDRLGASFVRFIALQWRDEDDKRPESESRDPIYRTGKHWSTDEGVRE